MRRQLKIMSIFILFSAVLSAKEICPLGVATATKSASLKTVGRNIEIQWSGLSQSLAHSISGTLELTEGTIDSIVILEGSGKVSENSWKLTTEGSSCRIRVDLHIPDIVNKIRQTTNDVTEHAAILTVQANAGSFSFFPINVDSDTNIVMPDLKVLVTAAGNNISYTEAYYNIAKTKQQTMLEKLADEPTMTADEAKKMIPQPHQSDMVLGLDRNWESFWINPHGCRVSMEERNTEEKATLYDPYARNFTNQRHFLVGPVSLKKKSNEQLIPLTTVNIKRSIEDNYLPISHISYDAENLHVDITGFAGTLQEPLTLSSAGKEPALAVFYKATVRNTGGTVQNVHFALQPEDVNTGAGVLDENGRLLSSEMPGLFQGIAKIDGASPENSMWTVSLAPGQETTYKMVMPYTPQSRSVIDSAINLDFDKKHAEVRDYWNQRVTNLMQLNLPEQQLNYDYKAGLIHILLRVYPGRYQATTDNPFYKYKTTAKDYGVWNGRFCPIASESMPMIRFLDFAGFSRDFVKECLQYYYNRQSDDGRLQVCYYDIETPWVLWGTLEHFRMTGDTAWVQQLAPQIIKASDWIIDKRRESYAEPQGSYGRGLFAGHTADDAPLGGGRNFMFNGYMYMGLKAAGELLLAINNPQGNQIAADAALYEQDILATLDNAIELAPRIKLGDGFWYPAIPPQHNIRGLANWIGYFSHGGYYLHDAELGPLHMVFASVLNPQDQRVNFMLNVLSEVVLKKTGVTETQPAYSRHPYVLLQRGDVKNFLLAFYVLRYFQADRETGTWWEHKGGTGSPHKTHEESWWLHQLRDMLVLESGNDLKLCAGIPRSWLESGKQIVVKNASTMYGHVSMTIKSSLEKNKTITACIDIRSLPCQLLPEQQHIILRVPHPEDKQIKKVTLNGNDWTDFDVVSESVKLPIEEDMTLNLNIEF